MKEIEKIAAEFDSKLKSIVTKYDKKQSKKKDYLFSFICKEMNNSGVFLLDW